LSGGPGNDVYFIDDRCDQVSEKPDAGTDTVNSSVSFVLGANLEHLTLTGSHNVNGTGNSLDNGLIGNSGRNVLAGAGGSDTLTGGGGQDRFIIEKGDGTDTVTDFGGVGRGASPSAATIAETDTLKFEGEGLTPRNMLLNQNGDNLEITFDGVKDTKVILQDFQLENLDNLHKGTGVTVNLGNILFDGQSCIKDSFDVFNSESQQATIWNRNTVTFLNDLDNDVHGFNDSNDVINGQGGNDNMRGLSGDDILRGGAGDDTLNGGAGADLLKGGAGTDWFVFDRAPGSSNVDTVLDFQSGVDHLVFGGTTFTALAGSVGRYLGTNNIVKYDAANGDLLYDADGPGAGAAVTVAHLGAGLSLGATDFFVIA
jgi:Ca2+-binding RTX toxin-like protein